MTKVNLIHKSCKYADLIIEKISEYPHKEDMGR